MDLSYQEKSILGTFLAMVVVFGAYFASVVRDISRTGFDGSVSGIVGRLVMAVVAIVVIEIVYHIVLALESEPEAKDERDIMIDGKAYRNAYFTFASGAFLVMCCIVLKFTPFVTVNLVLLVMIAAELVHFLTQLFYYRRGF